MVNRAPDESIGLPKTEVTVGKAGSLETIFCVSELQKATYTCAVDLWVWQLVVLASSLENK